MEDFPIGALQAICLGSSIALSGLFYYNYRKKRKTLDKVDEAPHLAINEQLADLLNATPGKCVQYAVIEGTVQPVGQPLRSLFQKGSLGVIQKLALREHKLVWNSLARTWTDRDHVMHERVNSVPFSLVGEGGESVRVLCPLEASGLKLETVHEMFHQAVFGFRDLLGQYLSGEKPKGQLETEEMLKVGATLTGVGELFLDADRLIKLRPPSDGSEYFLTAADFEALRLEEEDQASGWLGLAWAFALIAAGLLLWAGRRHYMKIRTEWEKERMRREFERLTEGGEGDEEEEEALANACVVCLSNPRNCVLLDCGHVCCCYACYQALPQRICPICRKTISRVVPLYQV